MATMKHGMLVRARVWWTHLRDFKREFWKRQRRAGRRDAINRVME